MISDNAVFTWISLTRDVLALWIVYWDASRLISTLLVVHPHREEEAALG